MEFFETPQFLESSSGIEPQGLTSSQDEKTNRQTLHKKKEELSSSFDKKGAPLSKDSIKRSLQEMENEAQPSFIRSTRVTRSSASLTPTPSFLSSPPASNRTPQDGVAERRLSRKQMLLKKAMLFKSKSLKGESFTLL